MPNNAIMDRLMYFEHCKRGSMALIEPVCDY